jgi:hypothetical protein
MSSAGEDRLGSPLLRPFAPLTRVKTVRHPVVRSEVRLERQMPSGMPLWYAGDECGSMGCRRSVKW